MILLALCHLIVVPVFRQVSGAIAPPPWANPKLNPCATQPRGWQLLYWPPDGKCYKIFQVGHPCPEGMELSPAPIKSGEGHHHRHQTSGEFAAECRCPPKTAQYAQDGRCYELFSVGPCNVGHYFAPDKVTGNKRRWGVCKQVAACPNTNEVYWPPTNKCYLYLSRGPCPHGQLLTVAPNNSNNKVGACKCNHLYEMRRYAYAAHGCFEHFSRGPCRERGHLFLPDGTCGCDRTLPHYHNGTQGCYEIGTIGPCATSEHFAIGEGEEAGTASCRCKSGYVRYVADERCYRPYTQGACAPGHILVNATTCIARPCEQGYLFFPKTQTCHRIGTQGPCTQGYVITFDFNTRPSIDGVSYNGLCHCKRTSEEVMDEEVEKEEGGRGCEPVSNSVCGDDKNAVMFRDKCYKLYSQGPCARGAWLAMRRRGRTPGWTETTTTTTSERRREAVCECMPRYRETVRTLNGHNYTECVAPTVILADFLNKNFTRSIDKRE